MAEIVGLVASIVALTELTEKVIALCSRYISGVKSAEQDMKALNLELVALATVLKTLEDRATRNNSLGELRLPIQECTKQMNELALQLRPKKRRLINQWKWPLNETNTSKVLESIERSKSLFTLALTAEQFHVTLAVEVYTRNADRKLHDVKASLAAELAVVTKLRDLEEERNRVKERAAILKWLDHRSFDDMHCQISRRRHKHTGQWLFREQKFRDWIKDQPEFTLLWGYGIPGAGKTFISSLVIDSLQSASRPSSSAVAYIYFSYNEKNKQMAPDVLRSLIKQLAGQAPRIPDKLQNMYEMWQTETRSPSVPELQLVLFAVMETLPRVFFVFDALDECDEDNRCKELLPLFHLLGTRGASVFLTGRPYPRDMQESLNAKQVTQMELRAHEQDLRVYIEQKIEDSVHAKYLIREELREDIIKQLVGCCKGMFLLVHFHIEDLCNHTSVKQIRSALGELDSSLRQEDALNGIYQRALGEIDKLHRTRRILALRALAWLSRYPGLDKTEHLSLVVAVEDGMTDCDDIDNESLPDVTMILEVCRGLAIMDEKTNRIMLAHYSVKEYLVGDPRFMSSADVTLTKTYFTILNLKSLRHKDQILRYKGEIWSEVWKHIVTHLPHHLRSCDNRITHGPYIKFLDSPAYSIYCRTYVPNSLSQRVSQSTFLHSVIVGHMSVLRHFIGLGIDFSSPSSSGNIALYIAATEGHREIAQVLLQNGANPEAHVGHGRTALHAASGKGHLSILRLFFDMGVDISLRDIVSGNTPVHEAVNSRKLEVVKFLIENGADISVANYDGNTPVHEASASCIFDILRILVNKGADLSRRNLDGYTPFEMAAQRGELDNARYILNRCGLPLMPGTSGACVLRETSTAYPKCLHLGLMSIMEPNSREWGFPPLAYAVKYNFYDAVVHLLQKGADKSEKDSEGKTALYYALRNADIFRLLLDKGADTSVVFKDGNTLLHVAAYKGHLDMVRILLERGSDPSVHGAADNSPLHMAASRNHSDIVTCLLQFGADPFAKNALGYTPLYHFLFEGVLMRHNGHYDSPTVPIHLSKTFLTLLRYCDEPSIQNGNGNTALHIAAEEGSLGLANAFLEKGADPAVKNQELKTPLHLALDKGCEDVAIALIEGGADRAFIERGGSTLLLLASKYGRLRFARALLTLGVESSAQDTLGKTALHIAVQKGYTDFVLALLESGADQAIQDNDGLTPLHHAIRLSNLDMACTLVREGANPTLMFPGGRGCIHLAAAAGRSELVGELLQRGVDVSSQDGDGDTALNIAIKCGHFEVARMLIERGTDVLIGNYGGYTPLHRVLNCDHTELFDIMFPHGATPLEGAKDGTTALHLCLQFPERVQSLLKHGVDPSPRCPRSQSTPLHLAVKKEYLETARILLRGGALVSARNIDGVTPLHLAVNNTEITRLLLDSGADVFARDKESRTPLHHASTTSAEVVLLLLERGANPSAECLYGYGALHHAASKSRVDIVRVLLDAGASPSSRARNGCTPLHHGIYNYEIVQHLIGSGADPCSADICGITPLHVIAFDKYIEPLVSAAAQKTNFTLSRNSFYDPSVRRIAQTFPFTPKTNPPLDHNSFHDPSVPSIAEMFPLIPKTNPTFSHNSSHDPSVPRIAETLQFTLRDGSEAFMNWAIATRSENLDHSIRLDIVMLLLESGANPSEICSYGCTPLHFASLLPHLDIARVLLAKGADASIVCNHHETPLSIAVRLGLSDLIYELLQNHKQNLSAMDSRSSILCSAIKGHHEELVLALLENGVDVSGTDEYGLSPLHRGIESQRMSVFDSLLEHGADVSARSPSGLTPIHAAAYSHFGVLIIPSLLQRGADLSEVDFAGMNVLHHAVLSDNRALIPFLEQRNTLLGGYVVRGPESFMGRLAAAWREGKLLRDIYDLHYLFILLGVDFTGTMDPAKEEFIIQCVKETLNLGGCPKLPIPLQAFEHGILWKAYQSSGLALLPLQQT